MSENLKVLQVFIASPNDLIDERRAIKEVADELNTAFGKTIGLQIQLLGWEDRLPGFGRAQAQINEDVDKADLFIGFLWRRWGSDPGNPKYTSGFEEEFDRAVERHKNTGSPEISLFFKDVTISSPSILDDQLKRVLQFRESVASRIALFGTFTTVEEWKDKTWDLLHGYLLKLLKTSMASQGRSQPQAPPPPSLEDTAKQATGQEDSSSTSAAKQQVVRIWADALESVKQGELSNLSKSKGLDKLKIARLGLAAAGITNRDIEPEMPGVHLTNLLFKNRKDIELTPVEWLLVLRVNLLPTSGYQPGWYWIRKTKFGVKGMLIYLACRDEHAGVRKAALQYANCLNLSLRTRTLRKAAPIELLCHHNDPVTRKAALEYLAEKGSPEDLPLVEKLRTDPDGGVRSQAEMAQNAILLRDNATHFFESAILTAPWVSDDGLVALTKHVAEINDQVLKKGLSHPDTKIQLFAAKEMAARGLLSLEEIAALKIRENAPEVFRAYFLRAIGAGQKFSQDQIREALKPAGLYLGALLGHTPIDADDVLTELFKLYSYEELVTIADTESEDAAIAYGVLAQSHFARFGEKVRADLASDFAALRSRSKVSESRPPTDFLAFYGRWKPDIDDYTVTALSALASNSTGSDRELVLQFLESKTERIRIAAVAAVRRVGQPQDKNILLRIAEEADAQVAAAAAATALALAPGENGSASRLLKSAKPALVKLALRSLLHRDYKKVWPQVADRLYDENEEIRELTCAYAVRKLPLRSLVKLLDTYLATSRYFYNVVYFLDRAIYAKLPLRKIFTKEIGGSLD